MVLLGGSYCCGRRSRSWGERCAALPVLRLDGGEEKCCLGLEEPVWSLAFQD